MDSARKTRIRARKAAELGIAVPQVVGHRLARLAVAGPLPSPRDQREFHRMGAEKIVAFSEAWLAVSAAMWQANIALGSSVLRMMMTAPWLGGPDLGTGCRWQAAMAGALDEGFAPIHRAATANARRLARGARQRHR